VLTIFDKYILKNLAMATFVTAFSLTLIIILTQSIRFLELVIGSGASAYYFLIMIGLAIPKFLEVILPLAFAIGCIYSANKMINDREVIVMSAAGSSVMSYGRGFVIFTFFMMIVQFLISGWLSPVADSYLQLTRTKVKSHYATLLFREGVFNTLGSGLTVYVEERTGLNELKNLMIHDSNDSMNKGKEITILAKRGIVNLNDVNQQILIFDGVQYQKDKLTGQISRLDFKQYTFDITIENAPVTIRWQKPDERTLNELFMGLSNQASVTDKAKKLDFIAELNKRITTPLLYAVYTMAIFIFMFLGEWNRRQNALSILKVSSLIIIMQVVMIVIFSQAEKILWMSGALYIIPIFMMAILTMIIYRRLRDA
jgi:lipopolysaccharide export system permease protein